MTKHQRWLAALALLVVGALALAFGQGHWPNGLALVVGIACSARFFRVAHPAVAVPTFIVAHVLVWERAYAGMVPLPTFARIGMETGTSTVLALVFLLDRWAGRRLRSFPSTLVLPCGWVLFDLASARLSPGGTWGSLAYSLADLVIVAQVASLVGWTGLTFLLAWLGSIINWTWEGRNDGPARVRRGVVAILSVVAAVFAFGAVRLATAPEGEPVRVGCVIPPNSFDDETLDDLWAYTRGVERPDASVARARARIAASMDEHFAEVERAADEGARLVVWPEANPVLTETEEPALIDRGGAVARARQVFLGMGMSVFRPSTGRPTLNRFVLIDPAGEVVIDFLKATRVPGSGHAKGDGILPAVETDVGRVSCAICFDLDFPHLIRQAGVAGVELFLAPSNDWLEASKTHARMARLRAIEQGVVLIRPTKDGVTLVTDSTGRTRAWLALDDNRTGDVVVNALPVRRRTLYAGIGDLFAWTCGLLLLGLCGRAAQLSRRSDAR